MSPSTTKKASPIVATVVGLALVVGCSTESTERDAYSSVREEVSGDQLKVDPNGNPMISTPSPSGQGCCMFWCCIWHNYGGNWYCTNELPKPGETVTVSRQFTPIRSEGDNSCWVNNTTEGCIDDDCDGIPNDPQHCNEIHNGGGGGEEQYASIQQ